MNQLELLWNYQQADMEAERYENTMKRSPTRQRLLKYQDYLREQKAASVHLEEEVHAMSDRIDALKDAIERAESQLKALHARFESSRPTNSDELQSFIQETQRLIQNISGYEQELRRIRKDAADRDNQQRDIMQRAMKVRSDYDKLKTEYDVEYAENKKKLEELRAAAAEKGKDVEPAYMDKYKSIKQHIMPPLSKLNGDQCSGCRMSLPSAVLRSVRGGTPVECESCGRMIIQ
ncbi:MAG: hypothetical protein IJ157_10910 [Clostridia bacterium]|nr:hypothetical protein [Clostridia bacterium]